MLVTYQIDNETVELELEGDVTKGKEEILLTEDDNLLFNTDYNEIGYTLQPFLENAQFEKLTKGISTLIQQLVEKVGGDIKNEFSMEKYHTYIDDQQHLQIAKWIQNGWNVSQFPIDFSIVEKRMSVILGKEVCAEALHIDAQTFQGGIYAKENTVYVFNIRIVRPNKQQDSNPPHRDVWIDRLRNAVNIYVPLSGSTAKSSLPLIPSSHFLKESDLQRTVSGARINETSYSVPCVTLVKDEPPKLIRPNPSLNQVLVFSPYLVHGGGYNFEQDKTRISLEVRFWRR